ncbi:MAG: RNA-binding protein [Ruminococcus sp.]|nr:RNA-binding protein [Ruminococcus sp.]
MKHQMNLNPSPFYMIKSGEKTIELRLNDEKRRLLNVGDEIEFINTEDDKQKLLTEIVAMHHFKSFEVLYKNLPLLKCGYTQEDIANAKASDMDIYYSKEKQSKYGVLGIEIKVINE